MSVGSDMRPRRCVVTLGVMEQPPPGHPAVMRDFRPSIRRLEKSLGDFGGDFLYWDDSYPTGSPTHRDSPCGYKPFCFQEALAEGYTSVLWLDATIRARRSIAPLFELIEREGYLIFAEDHSVGEYCKDDALQPLGLSREDSFKMRSCWATAIGLDLRTPVARQFIEQWKALALDGVTFPGPRWSGVRGFPAVASSDPRVKGHRYDQTAASVVAVRLGMTRWRSKEMFSAFLSNNRRAVPTRAVAVSDEKVRRTTRVSGPEAAADAIKVLFFSRGRGRGHAVPDMAIADELSGIDGPELDVQFVSYGTGADAFRAGSWPVIDLGLPEDNAFLSTLTTVQRLISELSPDVVVAHEEFAVSPAAAIVGVPNILVTDWFPAATHVTGEAVRSADSIVFIGEPGLFAEPGRLRRAPIFVGPVVRKMAYDLADRSRARRELDVDPTAPLISVIPGAWATEERAPILETVMGAYRALAHERKSLFWLTGVDGDCVRKAAAGASGVRVIGDCRAVEQVMVASDVVITKGNRGTIMDAASLGVPSVSFSFGYNPVDEAMVAGVCSNKIFSAAAAHAGVLGDYLARLLSTPWETRARPLGLHQVGGKIAAEALAAEIRRLASRMGGTLTAAAAPRTAAVPLPLAPTHG